MPGSCQFKINGDRDFHNYVKVQFPSCYYHVRQLNRSRLLFGFAIKGTDTFILQQF